MHARRASDRQVARPFARQPRLELHQLPEAIFNDVIDDLGKSKGKKLSHFALLTHLTKGKEVLEAEPPGQSGSVMGIRISREELARPHRVSRATRKPTRVARDSAKFCRGELSEVVPRSSESYDRCPSRSRSGSIETSGVTGNDELKGELDRSKAVSGEQEHPSVSSSLQTGDTTLAERGIDQFGTSITAAKESIAELLQTSVNSFYTKVVSMLTNLAGRPRDPQRRTTEEDDDNLV